MYKQLDDGSVVLEGVSSLEVINRTDLSSTMAPYVRKLESNTTTVKSQSTPYLRAQNGREYRMEVGISMSGGYDYTIIDRSAPSSPVAMYNDRAVALENLENVLGSAGAKMIKQQ